MASGTPPVPLTWCAAMQRPFHSKIHSPGTDYIQFHNMHNCVYPQRDDIHMLRLVSQQVKLAETADSWIYSYQTARRIKHASVQIGLRKNSLPLQAKWLHIRGMDCRLQKATCQLHSSHFVTKLQPFCPLHMHSGISGILVFVAELSSCML